jgi:hypothetical protein
MFQPRRYFTQDASATEPLDSHKYCLPMQPNTKKRLDDYIEKNKPLEHVIRETINNEVDRTINDLISQAEGVSER